MKTVVLYQDVVSETLSQCSLPDVCLIKVIVSGMRVDNLSFLRLDDGKTLTCDDVLVEVSHARVLFFVSLQVRSYLEKKSIFPSLIDSPTDFTPSFLMSTFSESLLTGFCALMPLGFVQNSFKTLFQEGESVFIKPNTGYKTFSGQCVNKKDFSLFCKTIKVPDDTLVFVSKPVAFHGEVRCFVDTVSRRILGQSRYYHDDICEPDDSITLPDVSDKDIQDCIKDGVYTLPDVITMDFAYTDDGYRLIEINSASTSGVYDVPVQDLISGLIECIV